MTSFIEQCQLTEYEIARIRKYHRSGVPHPASKAVSRETVRKTLQKVIKEIEWRGKELCCQEVEWIVDDLKRMAEEAA